MGMLRGLWRSTMVGRSIDTIKNMVDEGSVVEGYKRTIKEDWTEDNPVGKTIYNSGKYDGKKEGYVEASYEYEKKLIEQANKFTNEKDTFQRERDEYEALLSEFDKEIQALQEKNNKSQKEVELLNQLLLKERELKQLGK